MPNRLAAATSPYLQQHADNPVDWFEWGDAAFADARDRNVPLLLSVGYSACHWCHVMAHESFEHDETASMMNERFVSVKVDREERPDVDAIYMDAVTAMTGHGGWPMTVFLTPNGSPFYAGTYFPRDRHPGMPAFRDVLVAVSDLWRQRPDEVHGQATTVVQRLEEMRAGVVIGQEAPPTDVEVSSALASLSKSYDYVGGGFGTAPKFPPSMVLEFLLRHHARTGSHDALLMAEATMRALAAGGIYDQLGGGFARYAVDSRWVVPHFEKMLYDNAQLASVALHLWRTTGRPVGRRLAEETADFIVAELGTSDGGFSSALDADSEGVEGRFYVWNRQQLRASLSPADADWAAEMFEVTELGTFEEGSSTLQRLKEPDDMDRYQRVRRQLLEARAHRVRPARDDKVVASWNGMAIGALAEVGALLGRDDLVGAAGHAADLLLRVHWIDGRLRRVSRTGVAGEPAGVLDDYANVAAGLLTLYSVTGDERWFQSAGLLLDVVLAQFGDGRGGFFDTAHDAEKLVRRPQDPGDNASPSGQAAAAGALLSYGALTGDLRYRDAAGAALAANARLLTASPRFAGWWLSVAEAWLDGPREVAVVGPPGAARDRLVGVALSGVAPGAVLAVGESGMPSRVRLLADREAIASQPAAYVCRHFACDAPTTEPAQLARLLGGAVPAGPTDSLIAK